MNLERVGEWREQGAADVSPAELFSDSPSSPLKKPPGEGTGPTSHANLRANLVGRVPPRGDPGVFNRLLSRVAGGRPSSLFRSRICANHRSLIGFIKIRAVGVGVSFRVNSQGAKARISACFAVLRRTGWRLPLHGRQVLRMWHGQTMPSDRG